MSQINQEKNAINYFYIILNKINKIYISIA